MISVLSAGNFISRLSWSDTSISDASTTLSESQSGMLLRSHTSCHGNASNSSHGNRPPFRRQRSFKRAECTSPEKGNKAKRSRPSPSETPSTHNQLPGIVKERRYPARPNVVLNHWLKNNLKVKTKEAGGESFLA